MDMPMKKRRSMASQAAARGPLPVMPDALMDQLVKGPMTPGEVKDLMLAFNKALVERAMGAEMNMHLGYRAGEPGLPTRTTRATTLAARPPSPITARCESICRVIAMAVLIRS